VDRLSYRSERTGDREPRRFHREAVDSVSSLPVWGRSDQTSKQLNLTQHKSGIP
jgi:hypothetical protein